MTTIFVLVESGGEYEDAWSHNCSAWITREAAEEESKRLAAANAARVKALGEMAEWFRNYHKENSVSPDTFAFKDYPRWPSGLGANQITPEMRAVRDAIEQENAEIRRRSLEYAAKWNEVHLAAVNAKRVELGLKPKDTMYDATNYWAAREMTKFEIQELELHQR